MHFITGITGQAGSTLAEMLIGQGEQVLGLVRRSSTNNRQNLRSIEDNRHLTLVEGDITDFSSLLYILQKYCPHYIYNAAAQSHVHTSFNQPLYTMDVTGKGVLNLLEAIRLTGLDCRFVQFSSSEMFGDKYSVMKLNRSVGDYYLTPTDKLSTKQILYYQDENTPMNPRSPYGVAKLDAYNATRLYRDAYGLFSSNAILYNMEGPKRGEQFVTRKITKYVARLAQNSSNFFPPLKLGNLAAKRDWNYCGDSMDGVIKLIQFYKPVDVLFASGETHSVEDFVKLAFSLIGKENWSEYVQIDDSLIRPAEVPYLCGLAHKAYYLLGWKSKTSFYELVDLMIKAENVNSCGH